MKRLPALLALLTVLAGCTSHTAPVAAAAAPVANDSHNVTVDGKTQKEVGIRTEPVESRDQGASITSTGQLQVNEDRTWHVGAITEGRLVSVPVHLGDTVKAGQIVARMHSHEVHDSQANRRQSLSELSRSRVLAEQASRVRDRTRRLFDLKAASREQLEAAETQYESAKLSVDTAQAEADKTRMHLTEFLEVPVQDDPHKESSDPDADTVPIRSPEAGTVIERLANVGSVVSSGNPVITVSDLSSLWLIASVNEADLSEVRPGQPVEISVRAYPDRTFRGKVFRLGERLDAQTRTLQVRVLVSNAPGLLKPDMFATVSFAAAKGKRALYVPESSVQEWKGKSVVFVQTKAGFLAKEISPGPRLNGLVQVLYGLEPTSQIVTAGALLLKSQMLKHGGD
jgi:cobalt-zinc-cadmium efflux system membrane fusion protein